MASKRLYEICALSWLLASNPSSLAQDALTDDTRIVEEDPLAAAREMILYARYREAIDALRSYLDRDGLTASSRNAALELLAVAQLATNASEDAVQTLHLLFARDPEHRLSDPDASPRLQAAFARAREQSPEPLAVELFHDPAPMTEREAPRISARLGSGADAVDELRLSYRDGARFVRVAMSLETDATASVSVPLAAGGEEYVLSYYLEALAPSGAVLASIGSTDSPLAITVPRQRVEAPPPVAGGSVVRESTAPVDEAALRPRRTWLWVALGVVAAGAIATGIAVAATSGGEELMPGTLGAARLGLVVW